jgi:protoporphyrinogen oxidase
MTSAGPFEVVIVGGGVAGLSTARSLGVGRVLVLEQAASLGGRVLTLERSWGAIDLGACFAFRPGLLPAGAAPPGERCEERGPIGALLGDELLFDGTARGLLERASPADRPALEQALFHQIHPGRMRDYSEARRADALVDWYPDHWRAGNGALVRGYAAGLAAEVWLGARVEALDERPSEVRVTLERNGALTELSARAVVVATPATVARRLVRASEPGCREFLESVRYGRYTVVAFELEAATLEPDFRFIMTPGRDVTLVMQQASADRRKRALLCYYDDAAAARTDALSDAALVDATRRELLPLAQTGLRLEGARATVQRWELSGTILDERRLALYRPEHARATPRIFLSGDYVSETPGWGYGMDDAVASGKATATLVNHLWGTAL